MSRILGISCYFHDAAACLIVDHHLIAAAAQERFSRVKHDNRFPKQAIEFCLARGGLAVNELDAVVFYEKPILKLDRIFHQQLEYFPKGFTSFTQTMGQWFGERLNLPETLKKECHYHGPVVYTEHHLSHAASSYYLSGFDEATVVTIDGVGEWATTTVGNGRGNQLNIDQEIHFPHSLGLLYSALTAYLGFSVNDAEYKVMGLAAYGDPHVFASQFNQLVKILPDGSYCLNSRYFQYGWSDRKMYTHALAELFGVPARAPESEMNPIYANIAAALQAKLEEVVMAILAHAYHRFPSKNLCLAGGVALNSVLNGKLLDQTPFRHLFIPPDPGDAGGAMGAALYFDLHPEIMSQKRLSSQASTRYRHAYARNFSPYLGPEFSWYEIKRALHHHQLFARLITDHQKLAATVAKLITQQKVIGWFQGRMEWGPRALGNRSILASAATEKMRDIINAKVKHRELFRPFAPVIPENYVSRYFTIKHNLSRSARYMLMVYPFKPKIGQRDVPAVMHVDGTGRLQTLHQGDNPYYEQLLTEYYRLTKVPILINTSFNVRGEPIVCTPEEAIACFLNTDIDYLVLGPYVVKKPKTNSPRRWAGKSKRR